MVATPEELRKRLQRAIRNQQELQRRVKAARLGIELTAEQEEMAQVVQEEETTAPSE